MHQKAKLSGLKMADKTKIIIHNGHFAVYIA